MKQSHLIVFLAPSGSGKSTCAQYLQKKYQGEIIKLADPLYTIQNLIYQKIGLPVPLSQDGELLQFLGNKIQTLQPKFLFDQFYQKFLSSPNTLVINDDCRPHNYPYLQKLNAIFIKIEGPVRLRTTDMSPHNPQHTTEWQEAIPGDFIIKNTGTLTELFQQLDSLMEQICG